MARRRRGRRAYDSDLTDGQWALITPLVPEAEPGGRPRKEPTRELVDFPNYEEPGLLVGDLRAFFGRLRLVK